MSKLSTVFARKAFTIGSAAAIFGAIGLAACSDSTGPGGTPYTLREVNGEELPFIDSVANDEDGYNVYKVSSGTLRLNGDRFTTTFALDTGPTATNLRRSTELNVAGTVTITEGVIVLDVDGSETDITGSILADTIRFENLMGVADLKLVKR